MKREFLKFLCLIAGLALLGLAAVLFAINSPETAYGFLVVPFGTVSVIAGAVLAYIGWPELSSTEGAFQHRGVEERTKYVPEEPSRGNEFSLLQLASMLFGVGLLGGTGWVLIQMVVDYGVNTWRMIPALLPIGAAVGGLFVFLGWQSPGPK